MKADHDQVEDLLNQALAFKPEQRAAFLAGACGADNVLREKVETLLKAYGEADGFLPEAPTALIAPSSEGPGTQIDKYKLLEKLGEGGFGVVYMAEQREPVKRRVALKIIKIGMDTREVVARFEAERQALAMMDHPNIAKILDAGMTGSVVAQASPPASSGGVSPPGPTPGETPGQPAGVDACATLSAGRPYFVMELVRGTKITDYCDEKKLSTRERLDLFVKVCQAVQHAHQKGIIHRDLKPSNILVTVNDGVAVPKVIDFGIAKATQAEVTGKTVFTRFHQFLGTPAYMSPEQAEMTSLDIDTRSDIYSLGVLLYELLTGKTPFDAEELLRAGLDEMRRVIREKEPARPSTRVSTLRGDELTTTAKRRGLDAPKLINLLRGDLDWIAMKCLEKDRARRYETANGLASDVQRHLSNEPVTARPPTVTYRLQKLVRRNKLAFAAAGIVATALVVGLGAALWQSIEKTRAYNRAVAAETAAKAAAAKSEQVAQFLQDMLKGVDVSVALGRDRTMLKEILDKTAERISKDFTNQPDVEADLGFTIANVYQELVQPEQAEAMHRKVLALRMKLFGEKDARVAASLTEVALALLNQGRSAEAEQMARKALAMRRRIGSSDNQGMADSVNILGLALQYTGKLGEAEAMLREGVAIHRQLLGESAKMAWLLHTLALTLQAQGNLEESETLHREALDMFKKLGIVNPHVHYLLRTLGSVLVDQGKLSEAEVTCRESLALARRLWREGDKEVLDSLNDLAQVLRKQNRLAEAEALDREWLQSLHARMPADDPALAATLAPKVSELLIQKRFTEAESLARECLAIREKKLPDIWLTYNARCMLGACLLGQQREAEAEPLLLSGYEGMKRRKDQISLEGKPRLKEAIQRLVKLYETTESSDKIAQWKTELTQWYREEAARHREAAEAGNLRALNNIAWLLATCEDSAVRDGPSAVAYAEKVAAATNWKDLRALDSLAAAYAETGQFERAVSVQNEAIRLAQDESSKKELAARLKHYESNTPYREP